VNAAETIQAAIEKLERLKGRSTPGDWWRSGFDDVFAGPGLSDDVVVVQDARLSFDAELIVTLHRTIDAQLALFGSALWLMKGNPLAYTHAATACAIRLAEAILGDS
jgi:hypothetical protein